LPERKQITAVTYLRKRGEVTDVRLYLLKLKSHEIELERILLKNTSV
jgi:hypothetical protein